MSAVLTIDVMVDNSTYLRDQRLTPPTKFWASAVASALKGLRVPMSAAVVFRRQGVTIRQARLDFLLRGDA